MGRTIFSIYWPSQFHSNFCSTATPVGKIIPIFYCFQHLKLLLTWLLMGCTAISVLSLTFSSHTCYPAALIPLHLNDDFSVVLFPSPLPSVYQEYLQKPRKMSCLYTGLNVSIHVYFLQWNGFSKLLLYFPLLVTPLVTGFQVSTAPTCSCSNSYDQIFGIVQGQYSWAFFKAQSSVLHSKYLQNFWHCDPNLSVPHNVI